MSKPWEKFKARLASHESLPITDWKHHQLLGYWLHRTKQEIERVFADQDNHYQTKGATEPLRHPYAENMRTLFRDFYKDPINTKAYLDHLIKKGFKAPSRKLIAQFHKQTAAKTYTLGATINRAEPLPAQLLSLAPPGITTFGELSFWHQAYSLSEELTNALAFMGLELNHVV